MVLETIEPLSDPGSFDLAHYHHNHSYSRMWHGVLSP